VPHAISTRAIITAIGLGLSLAGCASSPPNSAYVGAKDSPYNPLTFSGYSAQAVSYETGDQFVWPTQANPDPLKLDGNYIGMVELVSGTGECPNDRYSVLVVGDNMVTYAFSPSDVFMMPLAADGSFHANNGGYALDGAIAGDTLTMTVAGASCTSRFAGHSVLNKS